MKIGVDLDQFPLAVLFQQDPCILDQGLEFFQFIGGDPFCSKLSSQALELDLDLKGAPDFIDIDLGDVRSVTWNHCH
jgi:hypothetical protein